MTWEVVYTEQAKQDLRNIYIYISEQLLEPMAAKRLLLRLMDAVNSLDTLPFRHQLYPEEPWHSQGLRTLPVNRYLILYLPDSANETVHIVRIMYGGRDITAQLRETYFPLESDDRVDLQ